MDDHRGIILWREEYSSDGERFHEKTYGIMIFAMIIHIVYR
jgi:hypothetical protein